MYSKMSIWALLHDVHLSPITWCNRAQDIPKKTRLEIRSSYGNQCGNPRLLLDLTRQFFSSTCILKFHSVVVGFVTQFKAMHKALHVDCNVMSYAWLSLLQCILGGSIFHIGSSFIYSELIWPHLVYLSQSYQRSKITSLSAHGECRITLHFSKNVIYPQVKFSGDSSSCSLFCVFVISREICFVVVWIHVQS